VRSSKSADAVVDLLRETVPDEMEWDDERLLEELRTIMGGTRGVRLASQRGLRYVAAQIGRLERIRAVLYGRGCDAG